MEIKTRTLYLVGTPIGNLGDMTYRAVEVLQGVDFIAAEDTRNAMKLLNHFEIKKPLISYYQHNKRERGEMIISRMQKGETCALITDAGMPAISDPGEELCALCHEKGIAVSPIPGPCAAVCALASSGLASGKFAFEGFLSTATKSRREHLKKTANLEYTMIFYEAPHKLHRTLYDMYEAWGDRRIVLAREITKMYEEIVQTTLSEAIEKYKKITPRGEFVLVIEGASPAHETMTITDEEAGNIIQELIDTGLSRTDAVKEAAKMTGKSRNELYAIAIRERERAADE